MQNKKNKKSIMYDFLLKLLLAIIIFVPVVIFGSRLFRLSDQALDSYSELIAKIDNVESGEIEMDSMPLYMDQQTIILFFNKNKGLICFVSDPLTGTHYARCNVRPAECPENEGCVCLDRGGKKEIKIEGKEREKLIEEYRDEYNWGKVPQDSIAFFRAGEGCKEYDVEFVESCYDFGCDKSYQWIEGGSIISRVQIGSIGEKRIRTAYIKRCGDVMGVCISNPPCITDWVCNLYNILGYDYLKETYPKFYEVLEKVRTAIITGKNQEMVLGIADNMRIMHTKDGEIVLEEKRGNSEDYIELQSVVIEKSACGFDEAQYYNKGDKLLFEAKEDSEWGYTACIKKA